MIGIAIVGTGFGQKVLIPAVQECPLTKVVAVYHRDLAKAQSIAVHHNIPYASDHLEAIVSLPAVQAVSISTPPFLHYEMAKVVLEAGKHLLLEKPVTLTAQEARKLYHLAKARQVIVKVNFEYRFIPAWQMLAEILSDGYVGKKRLIKIDWLVSSRADPKRFWNWYAQKDFGGGVLGAIGSHTFDYINWLFGNVRQLSAQLSTAIPSRPDPITGAYKQVDAEDTCNIMLEFLDNTPCQICLSSVTYQGRGHWLEIYGDQGTLVLGSDNQQDYVHGFKLWGSQNGASLTEIKIPDRLSFPKVYPDGRIAPIVRLLENFVEAISTCTDDHYDTSMSLPPSLREGVSSQLLMDLTHQSNATGTWVEIPNVDRFLSQ